MDGVKEDMKLVGAREEDYGVRQRLAIGCGHPWSSQPKQAEYIDWTRFTSAWDCRFFGGGFFLMLLCFKGVIHTRSSHRRVESQQGSCRGTSHAINPTGPTVGHKLCH